METPRHVEQSDADPSDVQHGPTKGAMTSGLETRVAAPVVLILAVVCCAGPLLLAALAVTGAGAWLAAHRYTLVAAASIVVAAVLGWRIRDARGAKVRLPSYRSLMHERFWGRIQRSAQGIRTRSREPASACRCLRGDGSARSA